MQRLTLDADLTRDDFLGGAVSVWQPRKGYRAGVDAVLLAAATPAKPGQSVLELGCGVGTASLCLAARVPDLTLASVELQPDYAALAKKNGLPEVITADLRALPTDLRQRQFHHVIMNPPYFDRSKGDAAEDEGRDIGRAGDTQLEDWLDIGIKRTGPKGHLTLIQHITRLPEVLSVTQGRLGSIIVRPLMPRKDRPPNLFLFQGQQDGRAPFQMGSPLILHEGAEHDGDRDSYSPEVRQILRNAAPLPMRD